MALIKCKMCGGDLRIEEGSTVCECEYCGTRQTVPSADNEKKLTLFSRAGRLLRGCEFDKAAGVFETIVADFPEEAEAYWGLVLCKYGIEYVDDPATGKKIPTCHRSSFDSVLDDPNYEQACENTDAVARRVYRDEARQIEDLRKRIIEVSGKEEPYDIFISYKETDENGDRTLDSVIAQDIYTELTEKGYRVFFSRISLEDKLGTEYEPYIFAALNSAKVMLVVGTDYENFDAVWVKNEWSRFLKLIASGQKKTLIPVFKNMDAYDMPKEFAKLAAQDMGKVGAMQDLVRGVEKIVRKKAAPVKETVKETVVVQQSGGPNVTALLKRGQQALEDGDWDRAKEYFDRVLDMDAENSDAFFGLFLAETQCGNENGYIRRACTKEAQTEKLSIQPATERIRKAIKQYAVKDYLSEQDIQNLFQYDLSYSSALKAQQRISNTEKQAVEQDRNFSRATRYARNDEAAARLFKARLFAELDAAVKKAKEQEAAAREKKQQNYDAFLDAAEKKAEEKYRQALDRQEADRQKELAEQEAARKKKLEAQEAAYEKAVRSFKLARLRSDYQTVKKDFLALVPYKDSAAMAKRCDEEIATIEKAQAEEKERQRLLVLKAEKAKKARANRLVIVALSVCILLVAAFFIYSKIIVPGNLYKSAEALFESGKYEEAVAAFESLNGFKNSAAKIEEVKAAILERDYAAAVAILENGDYERAIAAFEALNGYRDSTARIEETQDAIRANKYAAAEALLADKKYAEALSAFKALGDYKDSSAKAEEIQGIIRENTADETSWNKDSLTGRMLPSTIAAGGSHTVALKSDGTVVATGNNGNGQCEVSGWSNIVAVAAGQTHTVGLRLDGTVVATGNNRNGQCEVSEWTDIVAVSAGISHTVGLRSNGTVVATKFTGNQFLNCGQCEVSGWTNIVAVVAGGTHTVGLRSDSTVVAVGNYGNGQCEVSGWADIVAVAAGISHTVGLCSDGTVVATKDTGDQAYYHGQCEVSDWTDIVAVTAGVTYTVGLRTDGTVVAVGINENSQCDVSEWADIKLPDVPETQGASSVTEPKSPFRIKPSLGMNVTNNELSGVVLSPKANGAAEKAGVRLGDVIVSINGVKPQDLVDFKHIFDEYQDDEPFVLELFPGGEENTITFSSKNLNASAKNIDHFGVVVSEVIPGGAAEKAGLEAGDLIVYIDGVRITKISFNKLLGDYTAGDTVPITWMRNGEKHNSTITFEKADNLEYVFGIAYDYPDTVEVKAGSTMPLLSINAVGDLDMQTAFTWWGAVGDGTIFFEVDDQAFEAAQKGIRIETVYDETTKIYTSTLWADKITAEASSDYYCVVSDTSMLNDTSSESKIIVK